MAVYIRMYNIVDKESKVVYATQTSMKEACIYMLEELTQDQQDRADIQTMALLSKHQNLSVSRPR